jgi:lipoprotein-anchoring transpeptidase ErfK/SrfK
MREAFLGQMYNPYYFHGGYAIHGSPSVPNYPASHGCIRVTMWDMDLLLEHFEVGMAVYIYGKRKAAPEPGPPAPPPRFV